MSKVSVIIPSYNHSPYVTETVESVFKQDIEASALEVIVIDDCSTDSSLSKLQELNKKLPFQLVLNEKNIGLNASIEKAIEICTGEYVCFLASDDLINEKKISTQLAYMQKHNLDCVYSRGYFIDENSNIIGEQQLDDFKAAVKSGEAYSFVAVDDTSGPLMQSALFNYATAKALTPIRRKFKSDDWAVILFLLKNFKFDYLDEPLFYYRTHATNTHKKYWTTLPMRLEIPCIFLNDTEENLRMKSISNIFMSHSASLLRDRKYLSAFRFFFASFLFGFPIKKIIRKIWK